MTSAPELLLIKTDPMQPQQLFMLPLVADICSDAIHYSAFHSNVLVEEKRSIEFVGLSSASSDCHQM
jgi:hypothetical protein